MPETIVTAQAVERRMRVGKFLIGTAAMRQRLIFSSSTMVNSVATLAVRYRISWLVVTKKHSIAQDEREIKESLHQSVLPFLS